MALMLSRIGLIKPVANNQRIIARQASAANFKHFSETRLMLKYFVLTYFKGNFKTTLTFLATTEIGK